MIIFYYIYYFLLHLFLFIYFWSLYRHCIVALFLLYTLLGLTNRKIIFLDNTFNYFILLVLHQLPIRGFHNGDTGHVTIFYIYTKCIIAAITSWPITLYHYYYYYTRDGDGYAYQRLHYKVRWNDLRSALAPHPSPGERITIWEIRVVPRVFYIGSA